MKKMDKTIYLNNKGNHCPYCVSKQLEGSELKSVNGDIFRIVRCLGCGMSWTDIYKLVDIEEDESYAE